MSVSTYEDFIRRLGFDADPVADTNAALEDRLEQYFLRPKYFSSIEGSPGRPKPSLVFAPRGSGKTAQRIILEKSLPALGVLPILYDSFPLPQENIARGNITLDYHLRNVVRGGVLAILAYAIDHDIPSTTLADDDRRKLSALCDAILPECAESHLRDFQSSLLGRR